MTLMTDASDTPAMRRVQIQNQTQTQELKMKWKTCLGFTISLCMLMAAGASAQAPGATSWAGYRPDDGCKQYTSQTRHGASMIGSEWARLQRAAPDVYRAYFAQALDDVQQLQSADTFLSCDGSSCFDGAAYQFFQGTDGAGALYWQDRETYRIAVAIYGAFLSHWSQAGYERGTLGFPIEREQAASGACAREGAVRQQPFRGKPYGSAEPTALDNPPTMLCWSPARGVWATLESQP
jgi:hypothetical protein